MHKSLQGANVISGTKRQHSGNMESGSGRQKQARIETNSEDMDLDESGTLCFTYGMQSQSGFCNVRMLLYYRYSVRFSVHRVILWLNICLQFYLFTTVQ